MTGRRVALALGSGGARGWAHLGVLQALQSHGHSVATVAGASMGALVGGVIAAERADELTEWATSLTQREVLRLMEPSFTGGGRLRAERVLRQVDEIAGGVHIEDLPLPFTAVATDLAARREVWFQHGPMMTAVRASIAIPGVITPILVDGRLMVDGGVTNPVPIEPTLAVPSDLTVAVTLSGPLTHGTKRPDPASPLRTVGESLRSLTTRLATNQLRAPEDAPSYLPAPRETSALDTFMQSFDAMTAQVSRYRLAANAPDITVVIPADAAGTMEFHRAAEMVDLGRKLTEKALHRMGLDE